MQELHYGNQVLEIAGDLAELIMSGASDLANDGKVASVPVAAYMGGRPCTVSILIGAGMPLLLGPLTVHEHREDPPETMRALVWLRDYLTSNDYGPYPLAPGA